MNATTLPIAIDVERITRFSRERGIRRLSLFGSVLRDDFDPVRSDVDVLVEFLPNRIAGWEFFRWADELSLILGGKVDLHTPRSLSRYFRDEVLREAVTIYEQA